MNAADRDARMLVFNSGIGRLSSTKARMNSKLASVFFAAAIATASTLSFAQQAAAPAAPSASAPPVWKYKTKRLARAEVDALLAQPDKLLVLDVRRPDELIKYGSFPVFLSIQNKDLEQHLAYLPKDRAILTVSNHANRAGAAGDLLAAKGFKVAGATGSEDYEQEGGKAVAHIQPPAPRAAAPTAQ
jgi:rhodanese-related sulfurtransferase